MRKFLDIKMDFAKFQDHINKIINYSIGVEKLVEKEVSNASKKLEKYVQDQVEIDLASHGIRTRTTVIQDIVKNFKTLQRTHNNMISITLVNKLQIGIDKTYIRRSTWSSHDINASTIINLLDQGRKGYNIPSSGYKGKGNVLVWEGKSGHCVHVWRSKAGIFSIHIPASSEKVDSKLGVQFIQKIPDYANDFVEALREKIKDKMY